MGQNVSIVSTRLIVLQAGCAGAGALFCWKINNSPEILRMTCSSCQVSSTSQQNVPLILTAGSMFVFTNLDTPANTNSNLLKVERVRYDTIVCI